MRRKDNDDGSWTWTIPNPLRGGGSYRLRMTAANPRGGKDRLAYVFYQPKSRKPLFSGADFGPSPMHAWDSKETAKSLLGFLTLRPGDTDSEYFDEYTPDQLTWAQSYGCEALAAEIAE